MFCAYVGKDDDVMGEGSNLTVAQRGEHSVKRAKQYSALSKSDLHEIQVLKSIWLPCLPRQHPVQMLRRAILDVKAQMATWVGGVEVVKKNPMLTKSRAQRERHRKEVLPHGTWSSRGPPVYPRNQTSGGKNEEVERPSVNLQNNQTKILKIQDTPVLIDNCFKRNSSEISEYPEDLSKRPQTNTDRPFSLWSVPKSKLGLQNTKRNDVEDTIRPKHCKRKPQAPDWFLKLCIDGLRLQLGSSYPDDMAVDCEEFSDLHLSSRVLQIEIPSMNHKGNDLQNESRKDCFIVVEDLSFYSGDKSGTSRDSTISSNIPKAQRKESVEHTKNMRRDGRKKARKGDITPETLDGEIAGTADAFRRGRRRQFSDSVSKAVRSDELKRPHREGSESKPFPRPPVSTNSEKPFNNRRIHFIFPRNSREEVSRDAEAEATFFESRNRTKKYHKLNKSLHLSDNLRDRNAVEYDVDLENKRHHKRPTCRGRTFRKDDERTSSNVNHSSRHNDHVSKIKRCSKAPRSLAKGRMTRWNLKQKNTKDNNKKCVLDSTVMKADNPSPIVKYPILSRTLLKVRQNLQRLSQIIKTSNLEVMTNGDKNRVVKSERRKGQSLELSRNRHPASAYVKATLKSLDPGNGFRSSAAIKNSKNSNNSALTRNSVYLEYADNQVVVTSNGLARHSVNQHRPSYQGRKPRKPARRKLTSGHGRRQTIKHLNVNLTGMSDLRTGMSEPTHTATKGRETNASRGFEPAAFREMRAKLHEFVRWEWRKTCLIEVEAKPWLTSHGIAGVEAKPWLTSHGIGGGYDNFMRNGNTYSPTAQRETFVKQKGLFVNSDSSQESLVSLPGDEEVQSTYAKPSENSDNDGLCLQRYTTTYLKEGQDTAGGKCENAIWKDIMQRSENFLWNYRRQSTSLILAESLHDDSKKLTELLEYTPLKHSSFGHMCNEELYCGASYPQKEESHKIFGEEFPLECFQHPVFCGNGDQAYPIDSAETNNLCNCKSKSRKHVGVGQSSSMNYPSDQTSCQDYDFEINVNASNKPTKTIPKKATLKVKEARKGNGFRKDKVKVTVFGPPGEPKVQVKEKLASQDDSLDLESPTNDRLETKCSLDMDFSSASRDFPWRRSDPREAGRQSVGKLDRRSTHDCLNPTVRSDCVAGTGDNPSHIPASLCGEGLEPGGHCQVSSLSIKRLPTSDQRDSCDEAMGQGPETGRRPYSVRPTFYSKTADASDREDIPFFRVQSPKSSATSRPLMAQADDNAISRWRSAAKGQRSSISSDSCHPKRDSVSCDIHNGSKRYGQRDFMKYSDATFSNRPQKAERYPWIYPRSTYNASNGKKPTDALFQRSSTLSCGKQQDFESTPLAVQDPPSSLSNRNPLPEPGPRPRESNFRQILSQTRNLSPSGRLNSAADRTQNENANTVYDCWKASRDTRPPTTREMSVRDGQKSCTAVRQDHGSSETDRPLTSPERIMQFQLQVLSYINQILSSGLAQSTRKLSCHDNTDLTWPLEENLPLSSRPNSARQTENRRHDPSTNSTTSSDSRSKSLRPSGFSLRGSDPLKDTSDHKMDKHSAGPRFSSNSHPYGSNYLPKKKSNVDKGEQTTTLSHFPSEGTSKSVGRGIENTQPKHNSYTSYRRSYLSRKDNVDTGVQTQNPSSFQDGGICEGRTSRGRPNGHRQESSDTSDLTWGWEGQDDPRHLEKQTTLRSTHTNEPCNRPNRLEMRNNIHTESSSSRLVRQGRINGLFAQERNSFHPSQSHPCEDKIQVNKKCQVGRSGVKPTRRSQLYTCVDTPGRGVLDKSYTAGERAAYSRTDKGMQYPEKQSVGLDCDFPAVRLQTVETNALTTSDSYTIRHRARKPHQTREFGKSHYHRGQNSYQNFDSCSPTSYSLETSFCSKEDKDDFKCVGKANEHCTSQSTKSCSENHTLGADQSKAKEDTNRPSRSPIIHIRYRSRKTPLDQDDCPPLGPTAETFNRQQISLETELGKTLAKVIKRSLQLQSDILRLKENPPKKKDPECNPNVEPTSSKANESVVEIPDIVSYDNTNSNAKCPITGARRNIACRKRPLDSCIDAKSGGEKSPWDHCVDVNGNQDSKNLIKRNHNKNAVHQFQEYHDETYNKADEFQLPRTEACTQQFQVHPLKTLKLYGNHSRPSTLTRGHAPHFEMSGSPGVSVSLGHKSILRSTRFADREKQNRDDFSDGNMETTILRDAESLNLEAAFKGKDLNKVKGRNEMRRNGQRRPHVKKYIIGKNEVENHKELFEDRDFSQNHSCLEISKSDISKHHKELFKDRDFSQNHSCLADTNDSKSDKSKPDKEEPPQIVTDISETCLQSFLESNYWRSLWDMNGMGQAKTFLSHKKHLPKRRTRNNIIITEMNSKVDKKGQLSNLELKTAPTRTVVQITNTKSLLHTEGQTSDAFHYDRQPMADPLEPTNGKDPDNDIATVSRKTTCGHRLECQSKAAPPCIKMDAWSEHQNEAPQNNGAPDEKGINQRSDQNEAPKHNGVPDDKGTNQRSDRSVKEENGVSKESDSKCSTHGIEDIPLDTDAEIRQDSMDCDQRRHLTDDKKLQTSSTVYDRSSKDVSPRVRKANGANLNEKRLECQNLPNSTRSVLNPRGSAPESFKGDKRRITEDVYDSFLPLSPGNGRDRKGSQNVYYRKCVAETGASGLCTDNKITEGVFNTRPSDETSGTESLVISSLVDEQTCSHLTVTQTIGTSDLIADPGRCLNKGNKETQLPNASSVVSTHAWEDVDKRKNDLKKAIVRWWNRPEVDVTFSPTMLRHERDVCLSECGNGPESTDQQPGLQTTSSGTTEPDSDVGLGDDNKQSVQESGSGRMIEDVTESKSRDSVLVLPDQAESQDPVACQDFQCQFPETEQTLDTFTRHQHNKNVIDSRIHQSEQKTSGSTKFDSLCTELKTSLDSTEGSAVVNEHLPLVGFGHVIEADAKRVVLEGAFYKRSSPSSSSWSVGDEDGHQHVLGFRLVFLRQVARADDTKTIIGTYRRQMETSRRHFTWRFHAGLEGSGTYKHRLSLGVRDWGN